jgi:hypothetical protein
MPAGRLVLGLRPRFEHRSSLRVYHTTYFGSDSKADEDEGGAFSGWESRMCILKFAQELTACAQTGVSAYLLIGAGSLLT